MSYKKSIFTVIFFIVIIFNTLALFASSRWPALGVSLNRVALTVVAPIQEYTYRLVSVLWGVVNNYVLIVSAAKENEVLKKELSLISRPDSEYIETKLANSRLRDLLRLKRNVPQNVVAAEVIAEDPSSLSHTIVINKGSNDGVGEKFPVVTGAGVVGLVTEVVGNYSRVLLITDPRSSVDAFVQRNRTRGVVEGLGDNFCSLEYVLRNRDVNVGDVVISSGLDGVFPKGVNIGVVSKVICRDSGILQRVLINPCVKLDAVQDVLVVVPTHTPLDDF